MRELRGLGGRTDVGCSPAGARAKGIVHTPGQPVRGPGTSRASTRRTGYSSYIQNRHLFSRVFLIFSQLNRLRECFFSSSETTAFGMSGVLSLTPEEMTSKASSPRCDHVLIIVGRKILHPIKINTTYVLLLLITTKYIFLLIANI